MTNPVITIKDLDHVNIRTGRLSEMTAFYRDIVGLESGPRPPFTIGGAWLYCGERAAVHLVEVAETPAGQAPRIEHFAFRAAGLAEFLARLRANAVAYDVSIVPQSGIRQVNIRDPEDNHIEIQFSADEDPGPEGL